MRVAILVGSFPRISETFILDQITGLIGMGMDVDIIAVWEPEKSEETHLEVERYNLLRRTYYLHRRNETRLKKYFRNLRLFLKFFLSSPIKALKLVSFPLYGRLAINGTLLRLYELCKERNYHIIHAHFGPNGIIAGIVKEVTGIESKIVVAFHGYDMTSYIKKHGKKVYKRLFKIVDLCLPISNYWKKRLIKLGCPKSKVLVHRMGIKPELFSYGEKKLPKREKYIFLTVARLVEKKGIPYALEAMKILKERGFHFTYMIVGDGPLKEFLINYAGCLGIDEAVQFKGARTREEVITLYKKAHIFILPSAVDKEGNAEGIPVVLMEALASGLPVVASNLTGIPEIIINGETGFLVPQKNGRAIAEKIIYVMKHPKVYKKIQSLGRTLVEKEYNVHIQNEKLVKYIYPRFFKRQ